MLAGVVLGALLGACIALVKYLADPYNQLPAITYWLLGSLAATNPGDVRSTLLPVLAGLVVLWLLRWRITVLSLGDEEAASLGIRAGRIRAVVITAATLVTAAVVSISGIIGWIGLIVPHVARLPSARTSAGCCRSPCCSAPASFSGSTRWRGQPRG